MCGLVYNYYITFFQNEIHTCMLHALSGTAAIRGCLITYVKSQVGVFLLKLHIMKREHSGGYVTDE